MPDEFGFSIDTTEWEAELNKLESKVRKAAIKKALLAGGEVIQVAMIALAPERTDEPTPESDSLPPGILKADIKVEIQAKQNLAPRAKIGPGEISGHVGRWIEQGWDLTTGGRKGKGGTFIRHIEGKHFISGAFDEAADAAVEAMLLSLGESLGQETGSDDGGVVE
jgi:hypothetical protein